MAVELTYDTDHGVICREVGHSLALYHYCAPLSRIRVALDEGRRWTAAIEIDSDARKLAIDFLLARGATMLAYIKVMAVCQLVGNLTFRDISRGNLDDVSRLSRDHGDWLDRMFVAYEVAQDVQERTSAWIDRTGEYLCRHPAFRPALDAVMERFQGTQEVVAAELSQTIEQVVGNDLRHPNWCDPDENEIRVVAYDVWRARGCHLWHHDRDWYTALIAMRFGLSLLTNA